MISPRQLQIMSALYGLPPPQRPQGGMGPPPLMQAQPPQQQGVDPNLQMGMGLLSMANKRGKSDADSANPYPWTNFLSGMGITQPYQGDSMLGQGMAGGFPYGLLSMFGGPR